MFWKKLVKDYLTFGRRDRIGTFVIITVVASSILLPRLLARKSPPLVIKENEVLVKAIDTLQSRQLGEQKYERGENGFGSQNNYQYESSQKAAFTNGALFQFDPNTISAADWQRMGLNEKTSKTIEKYVSKGGKFYKREDLMKIWGMPEGFYERVKDYIVIQSITKSFSNNYENKSFPKERREVAVVDVNEADTSSFIALPGIGSKLSARIISFREKLGGFYSVEQVGETYGLPDSTFQKIKGRLQVDGASIKKMNINTATKDELKIHPYIKWNLANAIVEYRNQHGAFKSLNDLKNIALVDERTFEKIVHYLNL